MTGINHEHTADLILVYFIFFVNKKLCSCFILHKTNGHLLTDRQILTRLAEEEHDSGSKQSELFLN